MILLKTSIFWTEIEFKTFDLRLKLLFPKLVLAKEKKYVKYELNLSSEKKTVTSFKWHFFAVQKEGKVRAEGMIFEK